MYNLKFLKPPYSYTYNITDITRYVSLLDLHVTRDSFLSKDVAWDNKYEYFKLNISELFLNLNTFDWQHLLAGPSSQKS